MNRGKAIKSDPPIEGCPTGRDTAVGHSYRASLVSFSPVSKDAVRSVI
jgi:hypothetical protein